MRSDGGPVRAERSAALEVLLDGLVDYAGLFAPASLPMADALARYAEYRSGPHAWMLGRFVVPVARLAELEREGDAVLRRGAPWKLSATGGAGDREAIERFNVRNYGRAAIDVLEGKAATVEAIAEFAPLREVRTREGEPLVVYVEVPVAEDPRALIAAIAAHGLRAKVRTGGVVPDAFPNAHALASFLTACAEQDVVFKATAGLHHAVCGQYPLTYEDGSAAHTMFGFLNVFLAAFFLRAGITTAQAAGMLLERNPAAFAFDDGGVTWQGHRLDAHSIDALRERFAASFGSCSFEEPVRELEQLGLI